MIVLAVFTIIVFVRALSPEPSGEPGKQGNSSDD
jgi:hypothetical protein